MTDFGVTQKGMIIADVVREAWKIKRELEAAGMKYLVNATAAKAAIAYAEDHYSEEDCPSFMTIYDHLRNGRLCPPEHRRRSR